MLHETAEHHKKAAAHHERAAYHHKEVATYHEAGFHEKAAYHARLAREHAVQAMHHASEGTSYGKGTIVEMNARNNRRGSAPCHSCDKIFRKIDLTSRGQCLFCAQANVPHKGS